MEPSVVNTQINNTDQDKAVKEHLYVVGTIEEACQFLIIIVPVFEFIRRNRMVKTYMDINAQSEIHDLVDGQIYDKSQENVIIAVDGVSRIRVQLLGNIFGSIFLSVAHDAFSQGYFDTFAHTIVEPYAVMVKMRSAPVAFTAMLGILEDMRVAFVAVVTIIIVIERDRGAHAAESLLPDGRISGVTPGY